MAGQRRKPQEVPQPQPEPSDEEQARMAAAEPDSGTEVKAEELVRGIDEPVQTSSFSEDLVQELRKPLDPNRVLRRKGRGGGQFEYLAGHDDKRRMNELFGFGNWSSELVEIRELAPAVEIVSSGGKEGFQVGYFAIVKVGVRRSDGAWVYYSDVGYGDGAEYGAAAYITARELAVKEAATDAFKRAAVFLGDQFGLILYAKTDERKRIERDSNTKEAQPVVRRESSETPPPRNWEELLALFGQALVDKEWLAEAVQTYFGKTTSELVGEEKVVAFQKLSTVYLRVVDGKAETDALGAPTRAALRQAFGSVFEGLQLEGPAWRMGPEENDRPSKTEYEEIPFGNEPAAT